jgi:hypothetical protein
MMEQYNGWTNKETWLVNIWFGDMLHTMKEEGEEIDAEYIENLVEEILDLQVNNETGEGGFLVDMLNCAVGSINFHELAKHYEED